MVRTKVKTHWRKTKKGRVKVKTYFKKGAKRTRRMGLTKEEKKKRKEEIEEKDREIKFLEKEVRRGQKFISTKGKEIMPGPLHEERELLLEAQKGKKKEIKLGQRGEFIKKQTVFFKGGKPVAMGVPFIEDMEAEAKRIKRKLPIGIEMDQTKHEREFDEGGEKQVIKQEAAHFATEKVDVSKLKERGEDTLDIIRHNALFAGRRDIVERVDEEVKRRREKREKERIESEKKEKERQKRLQKERLERLGKIMEEQKKQNI